MSARLTVVMPAYNEAAIIGHNLERLLEGDPDGLIDVVVVANGCSDNTAQVAAAVSPRVRVIELAEGSKTAALNAGDRAANVFPIAYVDADVTVTAETLIGLAAALRDDPSKGVGAPRLVVDTAHSSWLVRQYFAVWELTNYRQHALVGSGIYMLTREGRARFNEFPKIIADDLFVLRQFREAERLSWSGGTFTVHAPLTFRAQVHRSIRVATGNRLLATMMGPSETSTGPGVGDVMRRVLRIPRLWPAFPVYVLGYLIPRIHARRQANQGNAVDWNRDDTTRQTS